MKIIYEDDGVKVLIPAPKYLKILSGNETDKMIHIANKTIPTGIKYEIVADIDIPSDRTFRDAWEYSPTGVEYTSEDL